MRGVVGAGAGLVVLYTLLIALADAITKQLATTYAAPQMYAVSAAVVVALSLLAMRMPGQREQGGLRTRRPGAMALRAGATIVATLAFFLSFSLLPFAEVFLFIGLMPIFSALMARPILGDTTTPAAWAALVAGLLGVLCLFPEGLAALRPGHAVALIAALAGTFSIVLSRYIGQFESNGLAQVFYPNLALLVTMTVALPFVWRPMAAADLGLAVVYGGLLFGARWLLVVALQGLPAHVVTTLMKLQFVWMVVLGAAFFGEWPGANVYLGVAIVIGSGLFLVYDQKDRGPQGRPWSSRSRRPSRRTSSAL